MASKILSIYLQIPQNFNNLKLVFLQWQSWLCCELLVFGEGADIYNFKKQIGDKLPQDSLTYYPNQDINHVLRKLDSEYLVWLNPKEIWNKDFLSQAKKLIADSKHTASEIIYSIGFVRRHQDTDFAAEVFPHLSGNNAIYKNFIKPRFLSPCVKYFWKMGVIKSFNLVFEDDGRSLFLKEGLFTIDYFAAVYEQRNYTEPDFCFAPLGFLVKDVELSQQDSLHYYREKFLQRTNIWNKNIWQRVYWQNKRLKKIMKD